MAGVTKNNSKNVSSGKAKLPMYVYHPMPSTPCHAFCKRCWRGSRLRRQLTLIAQ